MGNRRREGTSHNPSSLVERLALGSWWMRSSKTQHNCKSVIALSMPKLVRISHEKLLVFRLVVIPRHRFVFFRCRP